MKELGGDFDLIYCARVIEYLDMYSSEGIGNSLSLLCDRGLLSLELFQPEKYRDVVCQTLKSASAVEIEIPKHYEMLTRLDSGSKKAFLFSVPKKDQDKKKPSLPPPATAGINTPRREREVSLAVACAA
jgi:hypothetical protein